MACKHEWRFMDGYEREVKGRIKHKQWFYCIHCLSITFKDIEMGD